MVKLGDKVRDKVSNFQGVVVARHIYLNGCDRLSVQPLVDKDGKLRDSQAFDAPQLVTIESGVAIEEKEKSTGGPDKFMDKGR